MIKIRNARYCNIKLLLIFLVIYGHLIEPQIDTNLVVSIQYKFIYLFHMPMYAFLSGHFIKDSRFCIIQLKKNIIIYLCLQIIFSICSGVLIDLSYPCWILWYLLSLSHWIGFAYGWIKYLKRKFSIVILITLIIVGLFVGYVNFIDRRFSLSITLVFFPYFFLGVLSDSNKDWNNYRFLGIFSLISATLIALSMKNHLTVNFLYHADPYHADENGVLLRLVCYIIGISFVMFLLTWIPDKRFIFTTAGTNTMPAYILHAPFAILLRELYLPWYIYILLTAVFLWVICRITQVEGTIYRITLLKENK